MREVIEWLAQCREMRMSERSKITNNYKLAVTKALIKVVVHSFKEKLPRNSSMTRNLLLKIQKYILPALKGTTFFFNRRKIKSNNFETFKLRFG